MAASFAAAAFAQESAPSWASGEWEFAKSANKPAERHENAYVRVGALFYLVGGRGERPVQVFDPAAETWTTRGLPPIEIHHFQAVAFEGRIYVIGALTGGFPYEKPVENVFVYDPSEDVWTKGPAVPADRRRGAAGVVVHDGWLYVVSGIRNGHADGHVPWFDRFDPATGSWERLPDAPRARDHFQAAVVDGRLYAAGGRRSSFATGETASLTIAEVDVFDLAAGVWETLLPQADLPTRRAGTTALHYDGKLIVIGGESVRDSSGGANPAHDDVEAYDPATGSWFSLSPLLQGRHGTQAIPYDGRIFIAAGSQVLGADEIDSQEVFIPGR